MIQTDRKTTYQPRAQTAFSRQQASRDAAAPSRVLQGAPVAAALTAALRERTHALERFRVVPTLAVVRVGAQADDLAYLRSATSRCKLIGIQLEEFVLPTDYTQKQLLDTIRRINEDPGIHGCLLFRPLPRREDEIAACRLLLPEKDVDCITQGSLGGVFSDFSTGYPPCTAQACMEILDHYGCSLRGRRVTVVGRSLVVGKPVAMMLMHRDATVTICHTKTEGLAAQCRAADILIAAAGRPDTIDETCVHPGQVVIDVGINMDASGRLCGDVAFDRVAPLVAAITPVPGGVGTVTASVLAKHVVEAAERTLR